MIPVWGTKFIHATRCGQKRGKKSVGKMARFSKLGGEENRLRPSRKEGELLGERAGNGYLWGN